jgi:hypothetical protein
LMLPVVFAAILVFLDTAWIVIIVPGLLTIYFIVQLFVIRAKNLKSDWFIFAIFMMVGYTSGLLFMTTDPIPLNSVGWICTAVFTSLTSFISVKYLRQMIKILKLQFIGRKAPQIAKSSSGNPVSQEILSAFLSTLHEQGFEIHWTGDIFAALGMSVWRR